MQAIFAIDRLEMQRNRGARLRPFIGCDGVSSVTAALPFPGVLLARPAGDESDLVGNHEPRIKTHTELPDQFRRHFRFLRLLQCLRKFPRATFGNGADEPNEFLAAHANPIVAHAKGSRGLVGLNANFGILSEPGQSGVGQGFEPKLVEGVGSIRDKLPQEDVFVGINRMDHQIQQLARLGLKFVLFYCRFCHGETPGRLICISITTFLGHLLPALNTCIRRF
jgi:hypothetical protein